MATTHTVTTRHDLRLAQTYVAYRNEVLWPTRTLQRVLMTACVVAVGFMVAAGPLRYAIWAAAGLILVWTLAGDHVTAWLHSRADRRGKGEGNVTYTFSGQGFRAADAAGADAAWQDYRQIAAIYRTEDYWVLRLRTGDVAILARDGVDGGAMSPAGFEQFLISKTGLGVAPLKKSVAAKVQQTQEARRGYLEANPGLLARTLRKRSPESRNDNA